MSKLTWRAKVCAILFLWIAAVAVLHAQTLTTLQSFSNPYGCEPDAPLVQGADGDFYGTTASCGNPGGYGSVFKITSGGALYALHLFDVTDGATPDGGTNDSCAFGGSCGTLYKITSIGTFATFYEFCSQTGCTDGAAPESELIQGIDGNLYGTTAAGGLKNCDGYFGCGTVFKIMADGSLTTLYKFCSKRDCADGYIPEAGLTLGTDGNFYGTTYFGGSNGCQGLTCGTVFSITPSGALTTLHLFDNTDGGNPMSKLVQGNDGNFYGSTSAGGSGGNCESGCGTVFTITPGGQLTTLHDFDGADGQYPSALVLGTDGNFYGTTGNGGTSIAGGTAFRITPDGAFTTLYNFCSQGHYPTCPDGDAPEAALVQGTDGAFYGTTYFGGSVGVGTVFSLTVGLGSFVKINPAAGKVGATVGILGTDLTGATSVTFAGTQTTFRVVSSSFIEAKMPSGATTGKVQVQLPSGTLSSNVPFYVLH
jgi:uncharacterized repeat protein (TIGR03803 family)